MKGQMSVIPHMRGTGSQGKKETVVEAGERCRQRRVRKTRTGPGPVRSQAAREEGLGDGWNPSPQARGKLVPGVKWLGTLG